MDRITIIIPVYKNKQFFLANLRHNLPFLKEAEIIVINDDPAEKLNLKLVAGFPGQVINNEENLGFAGAVNRGVKKASRPYILLLNSDIVLHDRSFLLGLDYFTKDKKTFAVSFLQKDKRHFVGKNRFFWSKGMFNHQRAVDLKNGFNGWAEGGSCLIDKAKFLELGGFDEIYSPFYWEDVDLSYRAWKRGWRVYFSRDIKVNHYHESTIGKYFDREKIKTIAYRNQFIFIWKNIGDKKLLFNHFFYLCRYLISALFRGDKVFLQGFFLGLKKLPAICREGRKSRKTNILSDEQVLAFFK